MRHKAYRAILWLLLGALCACAATGAAMPAQTPEEEAAWRLEVFSAISKGLHDAEQSLSAIDPGKPMVALTFDDGPSAYTDQILDLLEQYGCRATFFIVGTRVAKRQETVARAARLGCELGTHSWDHANLRDLDREGIDDQLGRSIRAIERASDARVVLMRPPYGAIGDALRAACRQLQLPILRWSLDTRDWETKDAQATYDAIMNDVQNGSIILCHDTVASTAEAMARVIPALQARGYQLVTVTEMFEAVGTALSPGTTYDRLVWPQ